MMEQDEIGKLQSLYNDDDVARDGFKKEEKRKKLEKRMTKKEERKTEPKILLDKLHKLQLKLLKDMQDVCTLCDELKSHFKTRRQPLRTLKFY